MIADSPARTTSQRIGILGGSFNPAHDGHVHIARLALERLALDQVWWLVSPQNPLKPFVGMATFEERFAVAKSAALADLRIVVSDAEFYLGTHYTAETLPHIIAEHPNTRFVWIMGADNLSQMECWENWSSIFHTVPIAVFARPPYDSGVLACAVAMRFVDHRYDEFRGEALAEMEPPAWIYFDTPLNSKSATQIRSRRNL
jgi:nicotinate-nucleotide adenylyltransferase